MIKMSVRAQKLQFVPRNPAVFGSVDTWELGKRFNCAKSSLTAEMLVRAGRDSAELGYRIWYTGVVLNTGDRVRLAGKDWLVVSAPNDSASGINVADLKAVDNA
jgi:hypothetical protein